MKRILLVVALFVAACSDSRYIELKEVNIEAQPLSQVGSLIYNPGNIFYDKDDGSLLLNNIGSSKYSLQRVYLESGRVENLVRRGRGRGEFIRLRINSIDDEGRLYGDDYPAQLVLSSSGELLSRSDTEEAKQRVIRSNRFRGGYVGYGNFSHPKSLLTLFDDSWQEVSHFGEFPDDGVSEADGGEFGKIMAYQGIVLGSDRQSRVAFVARKGEFFSIYDIDSQNQVELVYRKADNLPKYRGDKDPGTGVTFTSRTLHYRDACNTDKYIYILYSGKEMAESSNAAYYAANCCEKILVYDWDGNHHYTLHSDKALTNISVSSDDEEIVAIYHNDEGESCICLFNIRDYCKAAKF